jgi:hypothetical protein
MGNYSDHLNESLAQALLRSPNLETDVLLVANEVVAEARMVCIPNQGLRIIFHMG